MNLLIAILWSFCLVIDIIACAVGSAPNWVIVFCPLIILVMDKWKNYFKER